MHGYDDRKAYYQNYEIHRLWVRGLKRGQYDIKMKMY